VTYPFATIDPVTIKNCPNRYLKAAHYNPDGTCQCGKTPKQQPTHTHDTTAEARDHFEEVWNTHHDRH
jgi:hypothetical protein